MFLQHSAGRLTFKCILNSNGLWVNNFFSIACLFQGNLSRYQAASLTGPQRLQTGPAGPFSPRSQTGTCEVTHSHGGNQWKNLQNDDWTLPCLFAKWPCSNRQQRSFGTVTSMICVFRANTNISNKLNYIIPVLALDAIGGGIVLCNQLYSPLATDSSPLNYVCHSSTINTFVVSSLVATHPSPS